MTATTPGITLDVAGLLTVDVQLGRDAPGRPAQPGRPSVGPPVLDDSTDDMQQPLPVPQPAPQPTAEHHTAPAASASPTKRKATVKDVPPPVAKYQWDDDPAPSGPVPVPTASVTVTQEAVPAGGDGNGVALAGVLALALLAAMLVALVHVWRQRRSGQGHDLTESEWRSMWTGTGGPVRRRMVGRGGGRLAVLSPEIVEATERRRLMEAHLRDQLAGETETKIEEAYEKGFEIGYEARRADEPGRSEP